MVGWVSLICTATYSCRRARSPPRSLVSFKINWAVLLTRKYCWYTRSRRPASSLSSGYRNSVRVLGDIGLIKGDAVLDNGFIHAGGIKQVQGIAMSAVAGHADVIHDGIHGKIGKLHSKMGHRYR